MTLGIAPTAATGNDALLDYNRRGALTGLLAIEEHLQQLPQNADRSWCVKKHALLVCDHHLAEAVNHAARQDPRKAEACRKLRALAEEILKPSEPLHLPNLGDVAKLRNALRSVFSDPTLVESCSICSKDNAMHPLHPMHPRNGGRMPLAGLGQDSLSQPWYKNPFVILVGVGVFYAWLRSR